MRLDHQLGVAAETIERPGLTWLAIERAGSGELAELAERFGILAVDLSEVARRSHRPRLEVRAGYTFIVLRLPTLLARPRRVAAALVYLLVGPDWVVTLHDGDLRAPVRLMADLRTDPARQADAMASPAQLASAIVISLLDAAVPVVMRLPEAVEALAEEVFARPGVDAARQMAAIRRDLAQHRRALLANAGVLGSLADADSSDAELAPLWTTAAERLRETADDLEDAQASLEGLTLAYLQVGGWRLHALVRALAVVVVLALPALVIASLYAMNLGGLPWADSRWTFGAAVAVMLAAAVALTAFFRRQGWL